MNKRAFMEAKPKEHKMKETISKFFPRNIHHLYAQLCSPTNSLDYLASNSRAYEALQNLHSFYTSFIREIRVIRGFKKCNTFPHQHLRISPAFGTDKFSVKSGKFSSVRAQFGSLAAQFVAFPAQFGVRGNTHQNRGKMKK